MPRLAGSHTGLGYNGEHSVSSRKLDLDPSWPSLARGKGKKHSRGSEPQKEDREETAMTYGGVGTAYTIHVGRVPGPYGDEIRLWISHGDQEQAGARLTRLHVVNCKRSLVRSTIVVGEGQELQADHR
jgi:hypothetical protein